MVGNKNDRIDKEKETIHLMIKIYCSKIHQEIDDPCQPCFELLSYSHERLSKCPFGANKGSCNRCKVHCFKGNMRSRIKDVMRYAGPRLIYYKPLELLKHIIH